MRETWYVMEDGSCGDPRDIAHDDKGVLRHRDGRSVAMRPDGETPRSRGVDVDEEAAKPKPKGKDLKPEEPRPGYKTRESKVK